MATHNGPDHNLTLFLIEETAACLSEACQKIKLLTSSLEEEIVKSKVLETRIFVLEESLTRIENLLK